MNYLILIKTLIQAIKAVESLMPTSTGKDKFDACIAIVEEVVGDVSPLLASLEIIATNVVTMLRKAGIFATPSTPA